MALAHTHITVGASLGALLMAVVGAPLNWFSGSFIALVALRNEWPDLCMVWPTLKLMYSALMLGDPKWYKARDWTEYSRFHDRALDTKIADPLILLHRLVDEPFHTQGSGNWYKRLWWLDLAIFLIALFTLYGALVVMAFN